MKVIISIFITLSSCLETKIEPVSEDILVLYKSSDGQTAGDNEAVSYLSGYLNEMDLSIKYWDIDGGIPDVDSLVNIRAIITWYRDSRMKAVFYFQGA